MTKKTIITLAAPIGIISIILVLLVATSFGKTPVFPEKEIDYAKRTTINETTFIVSLHENQMIEPIVTPGTWQLPPHTFYIPFEVLSINPNAGNAEVELKTAGKTGWIEQAAVIHKGETYQYCDAKITLLNITNTGLPIISTIITSNAVATLEINYTGWCPAYPGY